jgi:uroporphyrin-3 C-methyltransferase
MLIVNTKAWRMLQNEQTQTRQLLSQLNALQQTQDHLQQTLQDNQKDQNTNDLDVKSTLNTLQTQLNKTNLPSGTIAKDWLLLKARYALELAALNARWGYDRNATMTLLKEANQFIEETQDTNLTTVRQGLAQDMLAQEAKPSFDETGLLSQLDAIETYISTNTAKKPYPSMVQITTFSSIDMRNMSWHERVHASLHFLKQFFIVRYHDDTEKAIMTPAYIALQREVIRLNVQETEWAVLHRNNTIYQRMLQQTRHAILHTFGSSNTAVKHVLEQLEHLKTINVGDTNPIPHLALTSLEQFITSQAPSQNTSEPSLEQTGASS